MTRETTMKILLVGANGTLGRAVAAELRVRHELIPAGRRTGDVHLDLADADSIDAALQSVGPLDAVISAAGHVAFGPLLELTDVQWHLGLSEKLMGQVNLALLAVPHLRDGGSITLTTGVVSTDPIRGGASAAMVNGGLESFVRCAALELPRGLRINAVSPGVLLESMHEYAPLFRGFEPVPAARAALGFARSVEGGDTGKTYRLF
ncbi:short chain dehydrogenase [Cognatiluteimonas profundi]|uniref:short chain dehydrogenase n=1 Tax=Cognatiluteimonas profundi TaxID=2594501 RepID=UPI00131AF39A|nr:short chain dehydrogenase [Lysobacter profundi]